MPGGKPAGMRCVQLDPDNRCLIFGRPERPAVCSGLLPSPEMCGDGQAHAMRFLAQLELLTAPGQLCAWIPAQGRNDNPKNQNG